MEPVVNLYKLGRMPYLEALKFQQVLFNKLKKRISASKDENVGCRLKEFDQFSTSNQVIIKDDDLNSINDLTTQSQFNIRFPYFARNSLILVEHEPVYTIGIRSKQYNDNYVLNLKNKLAKLKLKADFVRTNRGGLITFHGLGQLVAYPIIYLGDFPRTIGNRSVKAYVNILQATIIDTLTKIGLKGAHTIREYPGVWLDGGEKKIAFVGISCQQYVTMHGIAINCDCDLSWYDHIVSCGIEDKSITSIRQELLAMNGAKLDLSSLHKDASSIRSTNFQNRSQNNSIMVDECKLDDSDDKYPLQSSVEHVSKMFCLSFSNHFDCKLIENSQDSSITNREL